MQSPDLNTKEAKFTGNPSPDIGGRNSPWRIDAMSNNRDITYQPVTMVKTIQYNDMKKGPNPYSNSHGMNKSIDWGGNSLITDSNSKPSIHVANDFTNESF